MAKTVEDFIKRRLRSSNITVVISIALVLFLLGLMGLILINAQKYSDYFDQCSSSEFSGICFFPPYGIAVGVID